MKIYTKKGDKGETSLIGKRVKKTNDRVEAYGTVDELNSFIGVALVSLKVDHCQDVKDDLLKIQHELFDLGGDLANVTAEKKWSLQEDAVTYLEAKIDEYWGEAPALKKFILPGGEPSAAHLHVCRTVTRRAERLTVRINDDSEVSSLAVAYLNRLSDYFFAVARVVNARANKSDILYERGGDVFHTE
ncbi:ATP:cob(I)alamin adenosyltransferase [Salipaludibacillus neizhouensis]|uniref:Corrinoid adenosyltransferase n=1 Tax=Salipaludibacillus neizhouensis TaxID=885475 RepID=A0A3A9K5V1_9BACI|nr:cob(I)yrinic acid a,c-diamide adenosyltransferase [Salipaludibacillus neizhouensis]RKL67629.1 ATP:cob(I)alamin adenosyltransferase [Salipaludibacillus neizhouensis]